MSKLKEAMATHGWNVTGDDLATLEARAEHDWNAGLEFSTIDPRDLIRLVRAVREADEDRAEFARARRKGAEAMREAILRDIERPSSFDEKDDLVARIIRRILACVALDIRALPLPGDENTTANHRGDDR